MEILPVNDLDVALHNFVNKDDKLAFYSCVQYNLQETRVCTIFYFTIQYKVLHRILFLFRSTSLLLLL